MKLRKHRSHLLQIHAALHAVYWVEAFIASPGFGWGLLCGSLALLTIVLAVAGE